MNGKIYIIKNTINNKVYIGQTIQDVKRRFNQHLQLKTVSSKQLIFKAVKKYGKENFYYEVLAENIDNYEEMNLLEENFIETHGSVYPGGYNLCPGGQKWRRKPKLSDAESFLLAKEYGEGSSSRELSEKYGLNKTSILESLKKNGTPLRGKNHKLPDRTSKITEELMIELYVEKRMLMKDIAELLNVNVKTVNRAKNKYNLFRI